VSVLDVEGLTKKYAAHEALAGVTLHIEPGEVFALLGPNGAGKTTLIGIVCGLVKKTSGQVRLFGLDPETHGVETRSQVGLVPQELNFDPFFTVRESLELQLGYYGRPPDPQRVSEVLEILSLSAKANAPTRALSGGMKRRLLIAKALVHRPKLVFLDEPTAGVDVELRRDLTHYLEEAEALADRVGILSKGRLVVVEEKRSLLRRLGERKLVARLERRPATAPALGTLADDGLSLTYVERPGLQSASVVLGQWYGQGLPITDVEMQPATLEDVMLRVLEST
jgi:ABC-2 type transport system ATP-binding protein